MLLSGLIYIGLSSMYIFVCFVIIARELIRIKQRTNNEEHFDTMPKSQRNSLENTHINSNIPSYKRKGLEIEIPEDDQVNFKRPNPLKDFFKKNCFPLSLNFQISTCGKLQNLSKWFLSLCTSFTLPSIFLKFLPFFKNRPDYFLIIPMASCLSTSTFLGIINLIFLLEENVEKNFFKYLLVLIRILIYSSTWAAGLVISIFMKVKTI